MNIRGYSNEKENKDRYYNYFISYLDHILFRKEFRMGVKMKKKKNKINIDRLLALIAIFLFVVNVFNTSMTISGLNVGLGIGTSMCPKTGEVSLVLRQRVKSLEDIEVGRVYAFVIYNDYGKRFYVEHRLIDKTKDGRLVFKGDNPELKNLEIIHPEGVRMKTLYSLNLWGCD